MNHHHFPHDHHSDPAAALHDAAAHDCHPGAERMRSGGFGPGPWGGFGGFPGMPGFPGGPGFRGRGGRRAGKGDVRAAILSLLAEGASNGYGLIQAIAEKTESAWRPSPGSVYPTLQQLVDEGLIASSGDGRSTEYTLTDEGRAYVKEHEEELAAAWRATPRHSEADRALFESIGKLMGVVHQLRFASEAQRTAAIQKLDETRRALYLILAD